MFNKEVIDRIILKANSKIFGAGKYYLYIYYGEKAFEECECEITVLDTCLQVEDFGDQTITWIPYEKIDEMSIMNDIPDIEPEA